MIEWLPWTLTAVAGVSGLLAGHRFGRATRSTDDEQLREELAAAKRESRRLRQLALEAPPSRPATSSPQTPRAYGRLVGQLHGLTSVRSAVVVDAEGLPLTPAADEDVARAACSVALLTRLEAYRFIGHLRFQIGVDSFQARRLASGAWLFTQSRGEPLGEGALAVALAPTTLELSAIDDPPPLVLPTGSPQAGPLATELGRALSSTGLRIAAHREGEAPSFAGEALDPALLDATLTRLGVLARALSHFADGPLDRIDFVGTDERRWTFVPHASLLVAADDDFVEALVLERLCGRLRRLSRTQTVAHPQDLPLAV